MLQQAQTGRTCSADKRQRGFVLLAVLSALGLLAVVAASFTQIARSHVKGVHAAKESARAEGFADAGIQLVILDLIGARESAPSQRRFPLDAELVHCRLDDAGARLTIAVQDEAGKVDLNIATEPLLRALVAGLGIPRADAKVDAILDFRDQDSDRRADGAEREEYRAAGRPFGPRNGPFLAIEEVSTVLGVSQADADRMLPFVTIYSGLQAIDVNVASKVLVDVIVRGTEVTGGASQLGQSSFGEGMGRKALGAPLPAQFLAASTRRAFAVHSQALMPSGAKFVREAVVEFIASTAGAYMLRRWRRGNAVLASPPEAESLPPC
jgi:general secretion pathway protein K